MATQSIDEDRILRLIRGVILAILRTNAYAPAAEEALAFKLDSAQVPNLPAPRPWREIWVYSQRVEGIHLRGGPIARGGLRWSDRRDDFRVEILGLMKAQLVKNAVIVPTGAKGGFYPKQLPSSSDRDAWLAEGTESYRIFIRSLLSVTDNLVDGKLVHPDKVVIRDGERFVNRLVWMRPDESFEVYDKRHLFRMANEHERYAGGDARLVVELNGWRVCPMVCYDLRFPVFMRNTMRAELGCMDYDLLLFVANWPAPRRGPWRTLLRARAIENLCYSVGVNRVGTDGNGLNYAGDSAAIASSIPAARSAVTDSIICSSR